RERERERERERAHLQLLLLVYFTVAVQVSFLLFDAFFVACWTSSKMLKRSNRDKNFLTFLSLTGKNVSSSIAHLAFMFFLFSSHLLSSLLSDIYRVFVGFFFIFSIFLSFSH